MMMPYFDAAPMLLNPRLSGMLPDARCAEETSRDSADSKPPF